MGFSTTTEDASGEIVEQTPVEAPLDAAEVDRMIAQMVGEIEQAPPCIPLSRSMDVSSMNMRGQEKKWNALSGR